jgi:hypothetical protein
LNKGFEMDKLLTYPGKTSNGIHTFVLEEERGYLTKTACEYHPTIASYINEAKKIPGVMQILLTALGATEYWGPNVNGDGFREVMLAHPGADYGFETFLHYGKVYKHHCFTEDAKVLTSCGLVPISDIRQGDLVYTHKGRMREVLDTFRRKVFATFAKISVQGLGRNIECTHKHRFYVVRREDLVCPRHKNSGRNFCTFFRDGTQEKCQICGRTKAEVTPQWVYAHDINVGDYLVHTQSEVLTSSSDESKARAVVCGFFLADGCYIKNKGKKTGVQITLSEDRCDAHEKLVTAAKAAGLTINGPYLHKDNHTATFTIPSSEFALYVYGLFGEYSDRKVFPYSLIREWGREDLLAFVGAYIDGDGSLPKKETSRNKGLARVRSSSLSLLENLRIICTDLGLHASFCVDCETPRNVGHPIQQKLPSAVMSIPASQSDFLGAYSLRAKQFGKVCEKKGATSVVCSGHVLHRVKQISFTEKEEEVFNIEVSEDNSYQVFGLAAHNCNKDPEASYGDILLSVYNPVYHRVELIIGVDEKKSPDIIGRMENGDYPVWSMGTKIPYDVCSICGNKAPTRRQYCEHLRYMLNQIDPDTQRLVYADNINPKFFDISYVLVPADKTAMTLKKVAFVMPSGKTLSSAELAEKAAQIRKESEEDKRATMEKDVPAEQPPGSQDVLDEDLITEILRGGIEAREREAAIPSGTLDVLADEYPLPKILSSMGAMGIFPKPQEFQRLYLRSLGDRIDQSIPGKLDKVAACFDPLADWGTPQQRHRDALGISPDNVDGDIVGALMPFLEKRSFAAPLLAKRMTEMVKKASPLDPRMTAPRYLSPHDREGDGGTGPKLLLPILGTGALLYSALSGEMGKMSRLALELAQKYPVAATAMGVTTALALLSGRTQDTMPPVRGRFSPQVDLQTDTTDIYARLERMKQRPYVKMGSEEGKKEASAVPATLKRLFIGIPSVHMGSTLLQRHRRLHPYEEEGRIAKLIRKHPNLVSGVVLADAMLATKGRGTYALTKHLGPAQKSWLKGDGLKVAAGVLDDEGPDLFGKSADVSDYAVSSLVWPVAFGARNLPGRIVGSLFDQAALDAGGKLIEKAQKRSKEQNTMKR